MVGLEAGVGLVAGVRLVTEAHHLLRPSCLRCQKGPRPQNLTSPSEPDTTHGIVGTKYGIQYTDQPTHLKQYHTFLSTTFTWIDFTHIIVYVSKKESK